MPDPKPRERMFWLCCTNKPVAESKLHLFQKGHIVAELRDRMDESVGYKVQEWAIYQSPLPANEVPLLRPKILCIVPVVSRLFCLFEGCGNTTRIDPNRSAWDALMSHYGGGE